MGPSRGRVSGSVAAPPSVGGAVVARGRLTRELDRVVAPVGAGQLGLVCAPSGYGKTTLLASWARQVQAVGRAVAWCALDEAHNEPRACWLLVLNALSSAAPELAELQSLAPPGRAGSAEFIDELVECLEDSDVVLVLENVHALTGPGVLHDLNSLLVGLPPGTAAIVTSRSDPTLPALHQALLAGRLVRLRAAQLAFRRDEVARCCPELTEDQVSAVWERTEGWPVMVRLMGSSPRAVGNQGMALADQLFQEHVQSLSAEDQTILLAGSVPARVPVDLAVRLSEHTDAGQRLEDAARRSGMVTLEAGDGPSGEPVYRFHPMLRAYLHGELLRRGEKAERGLQRLTADWCVQHGQDLSAVEHAVAAADPDFLDGTMRAVGPGLINGGDAAPLLAVLARRRSSRSLGPWTGVVRAAALLDLDAPLASNNARVASGDEGDPHTTPPDDAANGDLWTMQHATAVHRARRMGHPGTDRDISSPLRTADLDLRILVTSLRGLALAWKGDLDRAEAELTDGARLAEGSGRIAAQINCLTGLAAVGFARSDFGAMRRLAGAALDVAESTTWADSGRTAYAHALEAWGAYQALDSELASGHATRAAELVEPGTDPVVRATVSLIDSLLALENSQNPAVAADRLHETWIQFSGLPLSPQLRAYAAVADARTSLRAGRAARIRRTADRLGHGLEAEHALLEAMEHEAMGRRQQARAILNGLTRHPSRNTVPMTTIEALVRAASIALQDRDTFTATQLTREALNLAELHQAPRTLLDAGEPLHDLLRVAYGSWGTHEELVTRVLDHATPPAPPDFELTPREMDVMRRLSRLTTVEEIGDELGVSVNTVKTHLRSIYRKLGVASRRAAVTRAHRSGLL
jgi:LuxR family transcriptional regulator, maltose regulon positive regulatory protein